ncbi:MAG: ATP-binding protein [Lachnospiraceae bacterium]|nr:ATP-binding protein [Lachnospiraceae bacterium]
MLFKRKVYTKLLEWKEVSAGSSAVLLEGARRIGKSTIVEEFAKQEYDDYMILDFAKENKDIKNNFVENMDDLDTFFRNLFLLKGRSLKGKRCVLIFDEVQLFPLARQAIKYLVADGRYDYIETGSLISIKKNVKDILIPSEEYRIKMYPMDFEEYLWAMGDDITYDTIRNAYEKRKPLGDAIHRKIMKTFRTYMAVGGMPQAVEAFVSGKTFAQIDFIKRNILNLYEEDLAKYDDENREKASVVYKTIPEQLENKNSHFKFSLVDKNARFQNYVDAVSFIAESMIGNECINVTAPEVALELFSDRSNFKLYMGDTGLLVTQIMRNRDESDEDLYKALIIDDLGINQGMILENMVAQMLRASGHGLYFHEYMYKPKEVTKEKKYEIDFMTVKKKKICPIEVKSSNYRSHKSFDYLVQKYQIKMEDRYIIYTKDLKYEEGITYIPIYMTAFIYEKVNKNR